MEKLCILVLIAATYFCAASAARGDNIDIHVNVDTDSKAYHQFKARGSAFNYGYNVAKKRFNQFQHKVRGPDDVTYGCYGFVDPTNGTHLYHYVSDLNGYRVVAYNKTTKIYRQRVKDSVKQLLQAVEENVPWDQLYFPDVCRVLYLSQLETNTFSLPDGYIVNEEGSLIPSDSNDDNPKVDPSKPSTVAPRSSTTSRTTTTPRSTTTTIRTKLRPVTTENVKLNIPDNLVSIEARSTPVRASPTPPRVIRFPPTPTSVPKRINNDDGYGNFLSKLVEKPIEIELKPRPSISTRRPVDNSILNLATTNTEVVIPKDNNSPVDLNTISQDVRDVKATLKKLISHLLSRGGNCNAPAGYGPIQSGVVGVQSPDLNLRLDVATRPVAAPAPSRTTAVASTGPLRTNPVAAYLPLILHDFVPGTTQPIVGAIPTASDVQHPLGAIKLALPAYPAYQQPQCPVCRGGLDKK